MKYKECHAPATHVWRSPAKLLDVCLCGRRLFDPSYRSEILGAKSLEEQRQYLVTHPLEFESDARYIREG